MFTEEKVKLESSDAELAVALALILGIEENENEEKYDLNASSDTIHLDRSYAGTDDSILEMVPSHWREPRSRRAEPPSQQETQWKEDAIDEFGYMEKYSDPMAEDKNFINTSPDVKAFGEDEVLDIYRNTHDNNYSSHSPRRSNRVKKLQDAQRLMASNKAMTRFTRASPFSKISAKNLIVSWNEMHKHTVFWMKKFHSREPFSKVSLQAHFLNSIGALKRSLTTTKARPDIAHHSIMRFMADLVKIYEVAHSKGVEEVSGSIFKLVEHVLGRFLSGDRSMSATSLPWVQTKEVLSLLFHTVLRKETAYGFLQLIGKTQVYFVDRWTKRKSGRDDEFMSYAVSELAAFSETLSKRLSQLVVREKFGLHF